MTKTIPPRGERIAALITTLVLARHGKAPKTSPDQRDEDRVLNELGTTQANKLAAKIGHIQFDRVLSSPLKRAVDTTEIATGQKCTVTIIPELTCPTDGVHPIDKMFNELGYKPMSDYFAHPLGGHLKVWGRVALEKVLDALGDKPNQTVLVGGHAVLQNALGWAFCAELVEADVAIAPDAMDCVLATSLGECEAFSLSLCEGVVSCEHIKLD